VVHPVPLHRVGNGLVLRLVRELRRVHPDDHQGVPVLLLELAQLVQHMQAVHTAERPEIQYHYAASEISEGEFLAACVDPSALADQLRGANACM